MGGNFATYFFPIVAIVILAIFLVRLVETKLK